MGAATGRIHVGGGNGPVLRTLGYPVLDVFVVLDSNRTELVHWREGGEGEVGGKVGVGGRGGKEGGASCIITF